MLKPSSGIIHSELPLFLPWSHSESGFGLVGLDFLAYGNPSQMHTQSLQRISCSDETVNPLLESLQTCYV